MKNDMELYDYGNALDRVGDWVDYIFANPGTFSRNRWGQMMWPYMLAAILLGVGFVTVKFAVLELRHHLYNRQRKIQRSRKKPFRQKQNQLWRTITRNANHAAILPLPPQFAPNLRAQWDKVHESLEEKLKFGAMLIELENYVNNSFVYDGDAIIGRQSGMKGFLSAHCPHIGYTTAMYYRMLALKAREVAPKGNLEEIRTKSKAIRTLIRNFDACLRVKHRHTKNPRRRKHSCRRNPIPAIRQLRTYARLTFSRLHSTQRRHYAIALRELVREFSPS